MTFTYESLIPPPKSQASNPKPQLPSLAIVTDGAMFKGKVWREMALQIYCEHGPDGYREVGHYESGAPFLYDEDLRISVSHTEGCLVVASKKVPSGEDLSLFNPETALGVDVERADRDKARKLRERFLTPEELTVIDTNSVEQNVLAWCCKEAMLKATMDTKMDWHHNITIQKSPAPLTEEEYVSGNYPLSKQGIGTVILTSPQTFTLLALRYQDYLIVIAI